MTGIRKKYALKKRNLLNVVNTKYKRQVKTKDIVSQVKTHLLVRKHTYFCWPPIKYLYLNGKISV